MKTIAIALGFLALGFLVGQKEKPRLSENKSEKVLFFKIGSGVDAKHYQVRNGDDGSGQLVVVYVISEDGTRGYVCGTAPQLLTGDPTKGDIRFW